MAKQKYYVVWVGKVPGIYTSWGECQQQVNQFTGAKFKAFESRSEAEQAYAAGYKITGVSSPEAVLAARAPRARALSAAAPPRPRIRVRLIMTASPWMWERGETRDRWNIKAWIRRRGYSVLVRADPEGNE